ncbi:MAG: hypothetical protein K8I29_12645 [Alphaproteobacteria bacterium]|uniref:Uncharacterized protein n=1 Tax=Candidatus Nitrobium versatile TaxID=2884831 RepID=A0A953JEE2_9BACT|nr:hypothetical protein [Candidatus Nitrobium versatile]
MVSYVSAVDSALILVIYCIVSCLWRNIFWIRKMSGKQVFTAFMAGVLIAAIIEFRQALVLNVWSYTPLMPTIGGIGISPLFQLGTTGLLAFWLTRRLTHP